MDVENVSNNSDEEDITSSDVDSSIGEDSQVCNSNDPIDLAQEHRYLGNLQEVSGFVLHEPNTIVRIPLVLIHSDMLLVPGELLPYVTANGTYMNAVINGMDTGHGIGVVSASSFNMFSRDYDKLNGLVGIAANILEFAIEDSDILKMKARGTQRFKILHVEYDAVRRTLYGRVKILPDVVLPYVLEGARLQSLDRLRSQNRNLCMRMEAACTHWPLWVYKNYDERTLVSNVKEKFNERFKHLTFVDDTSLLSFQLLKLLPLKTSVSCQALVLNSPIQRLRWISSVITTEGYKYKCRECGTVLARQGDVFSMCVTGPHGTFVNPDGYVHELLTFIKLNNYGLFGDHHSNFSWFPGYTWCILNCNCGTHLGWEFKGESKSMKPYRFWGIKNRKIKLHADEIDPESQDNDHYVH